MNVAIVFFSSTGTNDGVESREFTLIFYVKYVFVQCMASVLFPSIETTVQLRLVCIILK